METRQLGISKQRRKDLLRRIFPPHVADRLVKGEPVAPAYFKGVLVLFADVVGYTDAVGDISPLQAHQLLHDLYVVLDYCMSFFPTLYKVETIGDAFMAIGGAPLHLEDTTEDMVKFSLLIGHVTGKVVRHPVSRDPVQIRIGIHSGDVVGGVVGFLMPRFTFSGDTVNVAARMQSLGDAQGVTVSLEAAIRIAATFPRDQSCEEGPRSGSGQGSGSWVDQLQQLMGLTEPSVVVPPGRVFRFSCFHMVARGIESVKGKGPVATFALRSRNAADILSSVGGAAEMGSVSSTDDIERVLRAKAGGAFESTILIPSLNAIQGARNTEEEGEGEGEGEGGSPAPSPPILPTSSGESDAGERATPRAQSLPSPPSSSKRHARPSSDKGRLRHIPSWSSLMSTSVSRDDLNLLLRSGSIQHLLPLGLKHSQSQSSLDSSLHDNDDDSLGLRGGVGAGAEAWGAYSTEEGFEGLTWDAPSPPFAPSPAPPSHSSSPPAIAKAAAAAAGAAAGGAAAGGARDRSGATRAPAPLSSEPPPNEALLVVERVAEELKARRRGADIEAGGQRSTATRPLPPSLLDGLRVVVVMDTLVQGKLFAKQLSLVCRSWTVRALGSFLELREMLATANTNANASPHGQHQQGQQGQQRVDLLVLGMKLSSSDGIDGRGAISVLRFEYAEQLVDCITVMAGRDFKEHEVTACYNAVDGFWPFPLLDGHVIVSHLLHMATAKAARKICWEESRSRVSAGGAPSSAPGMLDAGASLLPTPVPASASAAPSGAQLNPNPSLIHAAALDLQPWGVCEGGSLPLSGGEQPAQRKKKSFISSGQSDPGPLSLLVDTSLFAGPHAVEIASFSVSDTRFVELPLVAPLRDKRAGGSGRRLREKAKEGREVQSVEDLALAQVRQAEVRRAAAESEEREFGANDTDEDSSVHSGSSRSSSSPPALSPSLWPSKDTSTGGKGSPSRDELHDGEDQGVPMGIFTKQPFSSPPPPLRDCISAL